MWSLKLFVSSTLLLLLMLHFYLFSTAIFMLTSLLNLLTACLHPLSQPRCTRLSTSSHLYSAHLSNAWVNQYLHYFISYTGKFWNSLPLSVKIPLMLTGPAPLASISPSVLFTGSGDKRKFFFTVFLFSLSQYPFNVKKKKKIYLLTPPSDYFIRKKLKFFIMTFSMPSLALILGKHTVRMESLVALKKLCFRARSLPG